MSSREGLTTQITIAQNRLYHKLSGLDLREMGISDYMQRYLGTYFANLKGVLQLYGRLLYLALRDSPVPLENFTLVDYGGGSGLISLLAMEAGVGTVVYNDIYDVCCHDAGRISVALGLPIAHIVCGDVDELAQYLEESQIQVNAIVSSDVLEHIYDLKHHFAVLSRLKGDLRIVYATSANGANPLIARRLRKKHVEAEYTDREKQWGHKERDTLEAYFSARKRIISAYAPELKPEEVEYLSRSTRGLRQDDIRKCVDEYRRTGGISYQISDPTNTCDPYTGNWCEHLIEFHWLRQMVQKAGFSAKILPGYYTIGGSILKRVLKAGFNVIIRLLGRKGVFMAPYYILFLQRITNSDSENLL